MASSGPPPTKEAAVVILDTSEPMASSKSMARTVCCSLIEQKMIFAPKDLVGVVLAGTAGTVNRLNTAAPSDYTHITVARPVMSPNAEFLKAIDAATNATPAPGVGCDMLDCIVVAADLIHEAVGDSKFSRRIFLVSRCDGDVKRKDQLAAIIDGLKARGITLIVVGVDFDDEDEAASAAGQAVAWETLTVKQRNEKVLHFFCSQLGGESMVVAVHDAVGALGALRKRHIAQRVYCKCVLDIGDIRIPVSLYTKALEQKVPSFQKVTAKGGEPVIINRRFFSVRQPDVELDPTERIKAYRYGRSCIPVTEVDTAQMKFKSERGMSALGFVPRMQVPLHALQGGSKAIVPVAGDDIGAGALAAFVQAMVDLDRVMLVRFVRCTNANPVLGACFPSLKAGKQSLYYAALPFAEDLRRYEFRGLNDVQASPDESAAVEAMVASMDLDHPVPSPGPAVPSGTSSGSPSPAAPAALAAAAGTDRTTWSSEGGPELGSVPLRLKETYNPALQHYYHAVRERYLRPDAPLAGMPAQVAKTATAWGEAGNTLTDMFADSAPARKRVFELLPPPPPPKATTAGGGQRSFWFHKVPAVRLGGGDDETTTGGPAKALRPEVGGRAHYLATGSPGATTTGADGSHTPSSSQSGGAATPAEVEGALRVTAAGLTDAGVLRVSTVDPVGTFKAVLARTDEDNVARAIHEMQEAILQLLKVTIGAQFYSRCADALRALRVACVNEGEPAAFNTFLIHVMLRTRGDAHDAFWNTSVVAGGIRPITMSECPESTLQNEAAATFFEDNLPARRILVDDEPEEPSLFDELE